jgi:F-type H+-transporting ATPase subunit gamma
MASQREIRRRIRAVGNIKQITRAQQFIAASKLKRAQEATLAARPYSEKIDEVLADLATVLTGEDHPLLSQERSGDRLIVLVTTDRGFAGSLNANSIRFALKEIVDGGGGARVVTVGRKGREAIRRAALPLVAHFDGYGDRPQFGDITPLARLVTDEFLSGTTARVEIVHSRFLSTLSQRPVLERLLPIDPSEDTEGIPGHQFIFEPDPGAVLQHLLPRYVATRLYQAILENKASEESSRMVAMKNATENAEQLIDEYTLAYNKVRQANITREMIEIASGANAS